MEKIKTQWYSFRGYVGCDVCGKKFIPEDKIVGKGFEQPYAKNLCSWGCIQDHAGDLFEKGILKH